MLGATIGNCKYFTVSLFLSLFCVMTQNAPVDPVESKELPPLTVKTQQFYCTSVLLKNLVKFMVQVTTLHV